MSSMNYFGSMATTYAGRLRWNFMYQDPSVRADRAKRVTDRAVKCLVEAVAGDSGK
jgi:hypothetical protein